MTRLIKKQGKHGGKEIHGPNALFINGIRYANSAAKFWASLIDEVREDFAECDNVELEASCSGSLDKGLLFPELALSKNFEQLIGSDFRKSLREILYELEVCGPLCAVQIRLLSAGKEMLSTDLPHDCVDAEIFPYLLVWPLEWAGKPESIWNNEFLSGEIIAEERKRHHIYNISFILNNKHLSEGLYRRSMSISF